jgi:hypothetical protein
MAIGIRRKSYWLGLALLVALTATVYSQKQPTGTQPESAEDVAKVSALLDAEPLTRAPGDDELRWHMKQRLNAALQVLQVSSQQFKTGVPGVDQPELQSRSIAAAHRVAACQLDLAQNQQERIEALERMVALTRQQERFCSANAAAGIISTVVLDVARYERLDAEVNLLKEQAGK